MSGGIKMIGQEILLNRVDKMIEGAKHISDPPKYKIGPVSEEEKLLAWHKAIGSSQRVIDYEIEELRRRKGGSRK